MSDEICIPISLEEGLSVPDYATSGAAGVDLRSTARHTLQPMARAAIPTGIRIAVPPGFEAQIRPRSGLAINHGITMINSPGTIDSDYRGEIKILIINLGSEPFEIQPGDRVAQMVICPVVRANFAVTENLDDTARGSGGFGSTGKQ